MPPNGEAPGFTPGAFRLVAVMWWLMILAGLLWVSQCHPKAGPEHQFCLTQSVNRTCLGRCGVDPGALPVDDCVTVGPPETLRPVKTRVQHDFEFDHGAPFH